MRSFAIEDPGSPDPPLYATLGCSGLKWAVVDSTGMYWTDWSGGSGDPGEPGNPGDPGNPDDPGDLGGPGGQDDQPR